MGLRGALLLRRDDAWWAVEEVQIWIVDGFGDWISAQAAWASALGQQGPLVSADQVWGHLLIRAWAAERDEDCEEYFQPLTRSE